MVSIDMEKTGKHIKELMTAKGLNAPKVGRIMSLECRAVYKWIWGKCLPNAEHLVELSDLLEVPIEEILVVERR